MMNIIDLALSGHTKLQSPETGLNIQFQGYFIYVEEFGEQCKWHSSHAKNNALSASWFQVLAGTYLKHTKHSSFITHMPKGLTTKRYEQIQVRDECFSLTTRSQVQQKRGKNKKVNNFP